MEEPKDEKKDGAFPSRFRDLLKERKIPRKALASMLGVARQTIDAYCNGIATPNFQKLAEIARILQVRTDYLLGVPLPGADDPATVAADFTGLQMTDIKSMHNLSEIGYKATYVSRTSMKEDMTIVMIAYTRTKDTE